MRLLLTAALFAMAFAGCIATEAPDPLWGVCPQWVDGEPQDGTLQASGSKTFHAPDANDAGQALDVWTIEVDATGLSGTVELRAQTDDGQALRFTDYRDPNAPRTPTFLAINAGSGVFAVDVYLTDVTHGTDADPSSITLTTTAPNGASGMLDLTLTPAYRVCGAPLPPAEE